MTATGLGRGGEFDRIRAIARALAERAPDLGDDCAFLDVGGTTVAITTDVSVEGVHFRREWLSLDEIGWRAAAAALSDLAAGAADPIGILVALTTLPNEPETALVEIMSGAGSAAALVGATVLGGDLSRGPGLSIAITALGRAPHPMRRSGARPGDGIWVTGELGGARAAVAAWRDGRDPDPEARLRFASPVPRISAARWLAAGGATAMLDLSDGLAGDAGHLAAASGVTARILLERIPCHPAAQEEARRAGDHPARFAAQGGEDYELLVTLPAGFSETAVPDVALTRIGTVEAGQPGRVILELDGSVQTLTSYDHFA